VFLDVTAQTPDEVCFEENWFAVTAVDGTGLFEPAAHGLEPEAFSTGCYRGFVCRYAVVSGRLVLRDLEVGSEGEPPGLGGAQPRLVDFRWRYEGVDVPVAFTGRLLVRDGDPPDRPYLNMGFWPAWMYQDVCELTLRAGELVTATDCSADLAEIRATTAAAGPAEGEATGDWIDRTFSLAYDYSWPGRMNRG
jgi:hypothetical protein